MFEYEEMELVEKLAQSDPIYSNDYRRNNRGAGYDDMHTKKELSF